MYAAVAPPDKTDGDRREKRQEGPPSGVSEANWKANQDELNILREYGVPPSTSSSGKISNEDTTSANRKTDKIKNEANWKDLKQYLPHTSGLESEVKDSLRKQTEEKIDNAITKGQFEKAESLSEWLSTQEFAVKVASAVEARDYTKRKSEEQRMTNKKKKAKLHWGFEQKQRWESKGNL